MARDLLCVRFYEDSVSQEEQMQARMLIGASAVTTVAVALGACLGGIEGGQLSTVNENLEFVSQKREWLIGYDTHCNDCFDAFTLCQKGAVDDQERDTCQLAMDTCVRGGLISDAGDAGSEALVSDASDASDAGSEVLVEDVSDAGNYTVASDDGGQQAVYEDSGAGSIVLHSDGGRVRSRPSRGRGYADAGAFDQDAGAFDQDAAAFDADAAIVDAYEDAAVLVEDAGVVDTDAGNGQVNANDAKAVLRAEVESCLAQARVCSHSRTSGRNHCVDGLQLCVESAIEGVFANICSDQIAKVQKTTGSDSTVHSIQALCQMDLAR